MTHDEAHQALLAHAGLGPELDMNDPQLARGFLGMLRPYQGLVEGNFHDLMRALRVVAPALGGPGALDRDLMGALWNVCHLGRSWGLEPEGMLQRNGLITLTDSELLSAWLSIISDTVACLLDGSDDQVAFEAYGFYQADAAADAANRAAAGE